MKTEKSYAELKSELDALLIGMQAADIDVDEAIKLYERGTELIKLLEAHLKLAENKITKLKTKFD